MLSATKFFQLKFPSLKLQSTSFTTRQQISLKLLSLLWTREFHSASSSLIRMADSQILRVAASLTRALLKIRVLKVRSLISSLLLPLRLKVVCSQLISSCQRMTRLFQRWTFNTWPLHFATSTSTGPVQLRYQHLASMLIRSLSSTWRLEPPRNAIRLVRKSAARKPCRWGSSVRRLSSLSTTSFTSSESVIVLCSTLKSWRVNEISHFCMRTVCIKCVDIFWK